MTWYRKPFVIAVLVNPANVSSTESTLRAVREAAPTIGLQIQILNASTIGEIDAAFATFSHERPDALFVASDTFFTTRHGQFATLTAGDRIPAAFANRDIVAAGGLMSYGTDPADMFRQVGFYTGKILKGAKPADLPVVQSTKFDALTLVKNVTGRPLFEQKDCPIWPQRSGVLPQRCVVLG